MRKIAFITVSIALAGFLIYAISFHNKEIPVEAPGKVIATSAYEKYFGAAPTVNKGTAYAFVIYFPSKTTPGKVVPFPFFTFDEGSLKKVAVERLLGGMDIGSYQGEFIPFPSGIRLLALNDALGTVTVNLSMGLDTTVGTALAHALDLTLRQFKGATDIRLQVEGKQQPLSAVSGQADGVVQQPSAPRLLSVNGMREKGATNIDEVNAFFDRPVDIKELKLFSEDGHAFAGDMYHSVFDMAAVFRPKEPSQFKERTPVKVRWKVVDKLGRQAGGNSVWLLDVKEH